MQSSSTASFSSPDYQRPTQKLRILLADDHRILREGIKAMLAQRADMEVVAEAFDGISAVKMCRDLRPDIAILDVAMPRLDGAQATSKILNDTPSVRVIALSASAEPATVREILRAGALGYVLKESAFDELVVAIEQVHAGKQYLSIHLQGVSERDFKQAADRPELIALSRPERDVFNLLIKDKSSSQIAQSLMLSDQTVYVHMQRIMDKLRISSIAELKQMFCNR